MIHHVEVQVLVLLMVAAFVGMGARRYRLPYTLALVVAGLGLGLLDLGVLSDVELNADLLLLILLPALLFEAAFHIDFAEFRRNLLPIFTLAVPGVLAAGAATASLLYYGLGATGLVEGFGWQEALLFASVLAATDPVSVLALFRQFGVPRRLYLLVEGESLLNDGVAVVLFVIVTTVFGLGPSAHGELAPESLTAYSLQTFLRMGGGGVLIGASLGGAFSFLTRQIDDHLIETTLTTLLAYGSFLIAEEMHCSGVLSTVFAGIVAGSYGARVGMSDTTKNAVIDFWEYAAFLANSFIFLLVGLELEPERLRQGWLAIIIAFCATMLARGLYVYTAIPLVNRFVPPISAAWRHVLVWGGLRGSLSMVLILTLPASFEGRSMLVTMVFGVVGLSLFVQGLGMGPVLNRLGLLESKRRHDEYEQARATTVMSRRALEELAGLERHHLVEPAVAERLRGFYEQRASTATQAARNAVGAGELAEQLAEAVRRLIEAERAGLREAQHAEIVDDAVAERMGTELARRIGVLDEAAGRGEEELQQAVAAVLGEERANLDDHVGQPIGDDAG